MAERTTAAAAEPTSPLGRVSGLLSVENLSVAYGHIRAVKEISFEVGRGEIVCLLGSNGAGKTSTLFGIQNVAARTGRVLFKGREIPAGRISGGTREGLVLCPENRRIFPHMSVEENLRLGAFARMPHRDRSVPAAGRGAAEDVKAVSARSSKVSAEAASAAKRPLRPLEARYAQVFSLFPRLKERLKQDAGSLSGGEQQMLTIGRALMADPELLMIDEPSLGLAPVIVDEIFAIFTALREAMAILLVEQNAVKALSISDRAYIMQTGTIAASGRAADLLDDDAVRQAYLGL